MSPRPTAIPSKPQRTGRRVVLAVIGLVAAGAGVALAADKELRDGVVGSAKALGEEIAGGGQAGGDSGSTS